MHRNFIALFAVLALVFGLAVAQEPYPAPPKPQKEKKAATTEMQHEKHRATTDETKETPKPAMASNAKLTATLVEADKKAQEKAATVEVKVTGVRIVDPAKANEQARKGQGHIHYQLDDGPVIATTAMKLSFHNLTPGQHKLVVMLAGNDHNPLGAEETLNINIPTVSGANVRE